MSAGAGLALWAGAPADGGTQEATDAKTAYFATVAQFFGVPSSEVAILAEWPLPAEEIPVVLFVARRAGVSPEALVALRRAGRGWAELATRYQVGPRQFHVPLAPQADAGVLREAYRRYRTLPPERWDEVSLSDRDIIVLVNVRVLAQTLHRAPEEILRAYEDAGSFIELLRRLIGTEPE